MCYDQHFMFVWCQIFWSQWWWWFVYIGVLLPHASAPYASSPYDSAPCASASNVFAGASANAYADAYADASADDYILRAFATHTFQLNGVAFELRINIPKQCWSGQQDCGVCVYTQMDIIVMFIVSAISVMDDNYIQTWLILPVVICLSQRLSHAWLSTNGLYSETAKGSLNQLWFLWSLLIYLEN